ncbi:MAG: M50 family metallopeptidase [Kiritimatiellae bacterium]|nr:M50 family metallopeptidase [Kiritimatiellia bacterium]
MFKSSYQLCTVFGIPIKLDSSLILLAIILIINEGNPFIGLGSGIALLLSIALHELGHSLVAMAFGCKVRDITLLIIGGQATLLSLPKKPWQEFLVAFAGPLVSLLLALLNLFVLAPALVRSSPNFALFLYNYLGILNAGLFLFNLLPAFPMDGGRILRAFLQQFFMGRVKATWVASRIGKFIAILMAVSVLWSILTRKWTAWYFTRLLIAWFIYQAAEQEYRLVLYEEGRQTGPRNPFDRIFRSGTPDEPPIDDGKAVISPPPYDRWGGKTRVDVKREE